MIDYWQQNKRVFIGDKGRVSRKPLDFRNEVYKVYEKKIVKKKFQRDMEALIAEIRLAHDLRNIRTNEIFGDDDPIFPNNAYEDT